MLGGYYPGQLYLGLSGWISAAVNTALGITFPTSFFSTIQVATLSTSDISVFGMQADWVNKPSTSSGNYYGANYSGTATMVVHFFIIGT